MEFIMGLWPWIQANYPQMIAVVVSFMVFAEAVVKLTPTQTDDGFVKRMGVLIDKALAFVPSVKK